MKWREVHWPWVSPSRVEQMKIPLNLPLQRETFYTPLLKRGEGASPSLNLLIFATP
jgi:hypothetical protein